MRRALLSGGPGKSSGAPHPMETAGGPRSRRRAILVCLAGEAAGSVEPHTRAHTPREHAQCGLGNFLPSRGPPWPPPGPQLAKLGATGRASGGRGARLPPWGSGSPASPLLGPRLISRQPLPRLGTEACMSSTAPRGQVRGRLARGLAVWPPAGWTRWLCARHARGPRAASTLGGRGCVSTGTLAHTLAVTHNAMVS